MAHRPERFVSESPPRLVKRFLERFPLREQKLFFESILGGALLEEPASAKLFPPSNRSKDVRDALRREAERAGAAIRCGAPVRDVARDGDAWRVALDGESLRTRVVVVTTGGRSVLGGGADARGLDWAAALGHTIRPLYPALVPLVAEGSPHGSLAGISLRARVEARAGDLQAVDEAGFLFTHRGYSGPSVLNASHVVARAGGASRVTARFATGVADWDAALRGGSGSVSSLLSRHLPDRLAGALLAASGVAETSLARLTRESRRTLVTVLDAFPLPASGTEGYRTAEVTGGGVALEEVDPATGESRLHPGLRFAGEILDAFGPIGGFNFQWAWATGWSAGSLDAPPAGEAAGGHGGRV
jgi:predicted Rossmann fold flavoprotein